LLKKERLRAKGERGSSRQGKADPLWENVSGRGRKRKGEGTARLKKENGRGEKRKFYCHASSVHRTDMRHEESKRSSLPNVDEGGTDWRRYSQLH